jgi:hypothetical protein
VICANLLNSLIELCNLEGQGQSSFCFEATANTSPSPGKVHAFIMPFPPMPPIYTELFAQIYFMLSDAEHVIYPYLPGNK